MKLSSNQKELLQVIKDAGGAFKVHTWGGKIMSGPDGRTFWSLVNRGLISHAGNDDWSGNYYKVTPAGRAALEAEGGK